MIETGLVSISFRDLSAEELIKATKAAGLAGIEWGGDVHVPPGNVEEAKRVCELTEAAGMKVFSYGSYYIAGEQPIEAFLPILESAKALGAPIIRIWAGDKATWRADAAYIDQVIADTQKVCDLAARENIGISYEYHGWTLTDNRFSACDVHREIGKDNMSLYWQPNPYLSHEDNLLALKMVLPSLSNVHVFHWDCGMNRFPLESGSQVWKDYLNVIKADEKSHRLMFEYVKDDRLEQLNEDAQTLRRLLSE